MSSEQGQQQQQSSTPAVMMSYFSDKFSLQMKAAKYQIE
jgi:hypothetical protein